MDDYQSGEQSGLNKKIGAVTILVLMLLAVALTPLAIIFVQGQGSTLGVSILQVIPATSTVFSGQSQLNGTVGELFNIQGTIYTSGGNYQLIFGTGVIATGTADGYSVNTNFSIPALPGGSYSLILRDLKININSTGTSPTFFQILTDYSISPSTTLTQEGQNVPLTVSVSGGTPNTPYVANVSVVLPQPINTVCLSLVSLGTTNSNGFASGQVTFPGSSFQPNGTTEYVGIYNVYFNQTQLLGQSQFFSSFLDSGTYHRGQTVTVDAVGYTSGEAATLTIINGASGATVNSQSLIASADGTFNATWLVPPNAVIGSYNATIAPQGTQKTIPDVESFSIPGYSIQVETVNLAGEIAPQIQVNALDQASGINYNGTSDSDGMVTLNLESGSFTLTAFLYDVNVGTTSLAVTGNSTFTFTCQLTDLEIAVQNENGTPLNYVNLTVTFQYQPTNGGSAQTGNVSGQTDSSGILALNSTLTGISYTIQASLYTHVFNSSTTSTIPAQAQTEVVIVCPNEQLTINAVGYDKTAIPDATIKLVELTNGLFYTATTNSSGSVTSQVTFGTYKLQVYEDGILINETNVPVFGPSQQTIICDLYGIQVSVSVVDFFGSPIANANVTLNGPATEHLSATTQSDGTATFNNVVGGTRADSGVSSRRSE